VNAPDQQHDPGEAAGEGKHLDPRDPLPEEQPARDDDHRRVGVEDQLDERGGKPLEREEEGGRLAEVAERAHRQQADHLPARQAEGVLAGDQRHHQHPRRGEEEAQAQELGRLQARPVAELGDDRESAEGCCREQHQERAGRGPGDGRAYLRT